MAGVLGNVDVEFWGPLTPFTEDEFGASNHFNAEFWGRFVLQWLFSKDKFSASEKFCGRFAL